MRALVLLVMLATAFVAAGCSRLVPSPSVRQEAWNRTEFESWNGFRIPSGAVYCFMTGKQGWTGFTCFRPRDGFYARMVSRDLSNTDQPVRVVVGRDRRLRNYKDLGANRIPAGETWYSSDAQIVGCSVRRVAVTCRHWHDRGFFLGRFRHRTF